MNTPDLRDRLVNRAAYANVALPGAAIEGLVVYLDLLARWNSRINLTAFDLSSLSDEAIDRLVIEPLRAAMLIRRDERRVIDIGSGGGSPAVPLALAAPWIEMTMVEVRAKKAAFLREVARSLSVPLLVECARIEDVAASRAPGSFDLVTFRAVRPDKSLWRAIEELLAPGGRVFWFGGEGQSVDSEALTVLSYVEPVLIVSRI